MKLKIGLIGAGHLGKTHARLLKEISFADFIGVYDIDYSAAKNCAELYSVKAYHTIDDFLKEIEAATIVSTTSAHYENTIKCFEMNKPVLVEKPITATISEGEKLVKMANEKGLTFQVGHVERFNPALLALEKYELDPKFIQSDRLAQFKVRGTDVPVVMDLMIHDIDIILHLIKSEVKDIHASGVSVVSDNIDIANARISFDNGAVANITASRISQKQMRKMRMFQRDAYIGVDFVEKTSEVYRLTPIDCAIDVPFISFGEMGVGEKKRLIVYEQPEVKEVNALKYELELFIDAVLNNKKPVVSGEDGLKALKVAEEIIKKIEESKVL